MGSNGQQLIVQLPLGAGHVQIYGQNQYGAFANWQAHAGYFQPPGALPNQELEYGVITTGWWWKGDVGINFIDAQANFRAFPPINIPTDQDGADYVDISYAFYPSAGGTAAGTVSSSR
jgi:hypothetical protein